MTNCNFKTLHFSSVKSRKVQVNFEGGEITSDSGVLLLKKVDDQLGLLKSIGKDLQDLRNPSLIKHSQLSLLRQRVFALCLGYEDLNDHSTLRNDLAMQTAINRDDKLASASTLCRMENRTKSEAAWNIHKVIIEKFIASFKNKPNEIVLDFDATDDRIHGHQEGRAFHGYYDHYCFLPLYVFCKDQLLVSYLRPCNIDGAKHSWAILSLLVKRLRKSWSDVKIVFRGDGGFCRHRIFTWCEKNNVNYITGLPKNKRLIKEISSELKKTEDEYDKTQKKVRNFHEFDYEAKTWQRKRRVIAKIEHLEKGSNLRFIVTNLKDDPEKLYTKIYCARGEMENRIKEQQLGLFADRTSCHNWWPNQLRLLLSSLAYILIEAIRRLGLGGTKLANAQVGTIRLKLLKIGGIILKNTRRIRFLLSSSYPYQELFKYVARRLKPN